MAEREQSDIADQQVDGAITSAQAMITNAIASLRARTACSFLSSATRCTLRAPSEKSDRRHRRLLRARRERPRGCCAAEHPEKLPPPHLSNPKAVATARL
jgi:hypothetical protein